MNVIEIQRELKKKQSEHRYIHTIGVQYTSICLAMKYGYDIQKAELAGLLHDSAKHYSNEKLLKTCLKQNVPVSEIERQSPFLLHGKAGAVLAQRKYDIYDEDILNAIRFHTTGRPNMSLLEKIVFVADYIEPGRNVAPNLDALRKLSFENIDEAVYEILKQTLFYLKKKKAIVDPSSIETYNFYRILTGREEDEQFELRCKNCSGSA